MKFMSQEKIEELDHSKEVFAYFGRAVYYSQVLEHQLANMIVLLKLSQGKLPTEQDFDVLYERKFKNTLGQLIGEIKQIFDLTGDEISDLKDICIKRNFIVHDYFKERINNTFTEVGRNSIISELDEFTDKVRTIDKLLEVYSDSLRIKQGITDEIINNELNRIKKDI